MKEEFFFLYRFMYFNLKFKVIWYIVWILLFLGLLFVKKKDFLEFFFKKDVGE